MYADSQQNSGLRGGRESATNDLIRQIEEIQRDKTLSDAKKKVETEVLQKQLQAILEYPVKEPDGNPNGPLSPTAPPPSPPLKSQSIQELRKRSITHRLELFNRF